MATTPRLQTLALGARLVGAGLAGPWALCVLVLAAEVAGGVSGPCALTSVLLATLAAVMAALCHAEVSRQRHASLYEGAREVLGIRAALLLGWAGVVWRLTALAACARGLGATMDYIMGGRVRSAAAAWLAKLTPALKGLVLDPLACGAMAFTALLFCLGLERSRALRLLLNVCVLLAVVFFVAAGVTHCEPDAWRAHPFLPAGVAGLLTGAALSSAGMLGVTAVRAESARIWVRNGARGCGPSRRLELSTSVIALSLVSATSLAVTVVLTMMVHFQSLNSDAPALVQAFEVRDVDWARLVMATLGISALSLALVDLAPPLHRLVRALAADGLLPLSLARDCALTGTPVAAIASCGTCISLLALLSPLVPLLQVSACGALIVNAAFATSATFLRFQPAGPDVVPVVKNGTSSRLSVNCLRARLGSLPAAVRRAGEACRWGYQRVDVEERAPLVLTGATADESSSELSGYETDSSSSSTDIDAVVAEFKEKIKVATLSEYAPQSVAPDAVTARRASIALSAAFLTGCLACAALLEMLDREAVSGPWGLVTGGTSLCTAALLGVAARQPQASQTTEHGTRMPLAPWLPAVATLLHATLLMQLFSTAWHVIVIAFAPGVAAFAVREWRTSRRRGAYLRRRSERIHLHSPPVHPVVPTLVPSHQRLPAHSQRRLTRVDTILISR